MSLTESQTDLRALDRILPGVAKVTCDLKQDHTFLLGTSSKMLDVESEVHSLKRVEAEGGRSNPVLARWSTGSCQSNPESARSNVGAGPSTASSPPKAVKSSLEVEIISHPSSRIRVAKTTLDHELADLCEWFRRH
jgi:hypothetical protein